MSKEEKSKKETNPFAAFSLVNGGIIPPTDNIPDESEIKTGKDDVQVLNNEKNLDEEARLAAGTKAIEENIAKAEAIKKAKEDAKKAEESAEPGTKEEEEEETEPESETKGKPSLLKTFTNNLYEKNILDFSAEDEEFEDSEEGVEKLVAKTVDNRINKWVDSLPDEYTKFLQFVKDGGRPKDFLDIYYGNQSWEGFTIDSPENQKEAIMESLLLSGETEEDAKDMIADWEIADKLETRAKTALNKLLSHEKASKEALVKQQTEAAQRQKLEQQSYWDNFKKDLFSKNELMGFKLNEATKNKLWEFMTIPDKRTGETQYQKAVRTNKDSSLLFALQAMQGFDITKLEKQVKTKVASGLADLLRNSEKDSKRQISGGRNAEPEGEDPFKAFKAAKA